MQPEKWSSLVGNIKDNFTVKDSGKVRLEEEGGIDIEFIEFEGPLGLMRLEFISKPLVLDKKTVYSKRIGSETKIDYIYSEDEKSSKLAIYKWDDAREDWIEVDESNLF